MGLVTMRRHAAPVALVAIFCLLTTLLPARPAAAQMAPDVLPTSPISDGTGGASTLSAPTGAADVTLSAAQSALTVDAKTSVDPSTGAAQSSFPFKLPKARGDAQPSLGLTYSSSAAVGFAGAGWTLNLPSIVRRGSAGLPLFTDDVFTASPAALADANATFDEYLVDGKVLVPICIVGSCAGAQILANETFPASVNGWMYFRREVDDGARYFFSPDGQTWEKQEKSGRVTLFGHPLDGASVPSTFSDGIERPAASTNFVTPVSAATAVYRWNIVRENDAAGNVVYYTWTDNTVLAPGSTLPSIQYLSDIYDTSAVGQAPSPSAFAHHVHLTWQLSFPISQPIQLPSPIWRAVPFAQLATVDVTSASWSATARGLVRRYSLTYQSNAWQTRNRLSTIVLEGECPGASGLSPIAEDASGLVPNPSGCASSNNTLQLAQYGYSSDAVGFSTIGSAFDLPTPFVTTDLGQQVIVGTATLRDVDGDGAADLLSGADSPVTHFNVQSFLGSPTSLAFPADPSFTPCSLLPHYAVLRPGPTNQGSPQVDVDGGTPDGGPSVSFNGPAGCGVDPTGTIGSVGIGNGIVASSTSYAGAGASQAAVLVRSAQLQGQPFVAQYPLMSGDWLANGSLNLLTESANLQWTAYTPTAGTLVGTDVNVGACQQDPGCDSQRALDVDGDGLVDQTLLPPAFTPSQTYLTQRTHGGAIAPFSRVPPGFNGWTALDITTYASSSQFWRSAADMDGDGLPDMILAVVPGAFGQLLSWANHGDGTYGTPNPTAPLGTLQSNAVSLPVHVPFFSYTGEENIEVNTLGSSIIRMADINADGLADIIKLNSNSVTICLRSGAPVSQAQWGTPPPGQTGDACIPLHLPVVRPGCGIRTQPEGFVLGPYLDPSRSLLEIADIDGSGVPRILFSRHVLNNSPTTTSNACSDSAVYQTSVIAGASPSLGAPSSSAFPGLLQTVSLLGGAQTTISYQSVRSLPNVGGTIPVSAWAVTSIQTTNGLAPTSPQSLTSTVSYSYQTPIYDPRERQFVGFQTVHETHAGLPAAPGVVRTTTFGTTACGSASGTSCTGQVDYGWFRAIRGVPLVVEESEATAAGNHLRTTINAYTEHKAYSGLDGRVVRKLPLFRQFIYEWDPAVQTPAVAQTGSSFFNVGGSPYEAYSAGSTPSANVPAGAPPTRVLQSDEDDFGNQLDTVDFGQLGVDTPIRTSLHWSLPAGDATGWSYRVDSRSMGYTLDSSGITLQTPAARSTSYLYTSLGQLLSATASLPNEPPPLGSPGSAAPNFAAGAPPAATTSTQVCLVGCTSGSVTGIQYDAYGNATTTPRANGRCSGVVYDALFAQFPQTMLAYQSGCGSASPTPLQTATIFDRGLERATQHTAPFGDAIPRISMMRYDPFGRVVEVDQPMAAMAGMADTLYPALLVQYNDAGPIRQIFSQTIDGTEPTPTYQQHYRYVDGLGDTLVAQDLSNRGWIFSGAHTRYPNGLASQTFQPFFGALTIDQYVSTIPPAPSATMTYDGSGRRLSRIDFNGNATAYTYHFGLGIPPAPGITSTAASVTVQDSEQNPQQTLPAGQHPGSFTTTYSDGHGRTTQTDQHLNATSGSPAPQDVVTTTSFTAAGEPNAISQAFGAGSYSRQMTYDALGRMVSQTEPNAGTWSYTYNDSGELVGLADARGCGKAIYHDPLGRIAAEDYSPCDPSQPAYSAPNLTTGDGTEAFYVYDGYGQPAHVYDNAQHSDYSYDGRGRVIGIMRQVATPSGGPTLANRYGPQAYSKAFSAYSEANRPLVTTTGTELPDLLDVNGLSAVTASYSLEGTLNSIDSSYGFLMGRVTDASGRPMLRAYGDPAGTSELLGYDNNGALIAYLLQRGPPTVGGAWTSYTSGSPPDPGQTTQSVLASLVIGRDMVGNPTSITQSASSSPTVMTADIGPLTLSPVVPSEWPVGASPAISRQLSYGDDYRLQEMQTQYLGVDDVFVSPYASTDGTAYPTPAPVPSGNRVRDQGYKYDARGNVQLSTDDAKVFFDRSIGDVSYSADRLTAAGTNSGYGSLGTTYDAAGNLQSISITGGSTYAYSWDELGRLASATRTDPGGATVQQQYSYDAQGQRVRMTTQNSTANTTLHTVQVFDSLVLKNAAFPDANGDYQHDDTTEHLYLGAAGLSVAHVFFDANHSLPTAAGPVHVFLTLKDPLGSTAFVIDHDTSEVVEAANYLAYGGVESDYRPARWNSFREDARYTGHWDNSEVGLVYMNARYYSPALGRFVSPDPRTIHGAAGDLNPYAYAWGSPMRFLDPLGLYGCDSSVQSCPDTSALFTPSDGASHASDPQPSQPIVSQTDYTSGPSIGPGNKNFDYSLGFDPTVQRIDTRPADERFVAAVGAMAALADPEVALEEAPVAEGVPLAERGLADIARFRSELRLPEGEGTLAKLTVGDESFFGINAHGQDLSIRVNAISATHAEADAFNQALKAGVQGGDATLFVDRELCPACGQNGAVRSMALQLGLDSVTVVTPQGTVVLFGN